MTTSALATWEKRSTNLLPAPYDTGKLPACYKPASEKGKNNARGTSYNINAGGTGWLPEGFPHGARRPPATKRFWSFANHIEERLGRPAPENHRGGNGNEEIESKTSIRGQVVEMNGKGAIRMRRKIPPNSRPLFQGKPRGLRRCTVQQAQALPSVIWNLQHSRGVKGMEAGGRRPWNSPPARPAFG